MKPFPAAVILDMDGLLLDTERMSYRALQAAAQSMGLALSMEIYVQLIGLPAHVLPQTTAAFYPPGTDTRELFERFHALYGRMVENEPIPLRPGVGELLDFLDERALPRAVATSTRTQLARFKLEKAGILPRLGEVVGADRVAHGKPAPDIYLEAANPFNLPHAHIVVLEDSPAGIRGAKAAGMCPIMIPDLKPPTPEDRAAARAVCRSLSEFVAKARENRI